MILKLLIVFLALSACSYGANILGILPTPSYSHQIAYAHIWRELSLRGHKVTVITTDPQRDPKLTNLTEIDAKTSYQALAVIGKKLQDTVTMWDMHSILDDLASQVLELQLAQPEVQSLIHNKNHFDVILVEYLYPEYLALAEIYNCPKIMFSSLDVTAVLHDMIGNPMNPVLYPELSSIFYAPLSFKERVIGTLYTWYTTYIHYPHSFFTRGKLLKTYFGISKTIPELINGIDMLFINVNPLLQPIRALGPSTISISGEREILSPTPLPQDIAEFVDSAVDGFIYFSLGSNVKSKDLSQENIETIIETLKELPYKVLWKFEADELPNKPENVKLIKWAPQQSILSHPNIKLFITQGGLQSTEEAFYNEVPCVVIPFFGDQEYNAKLMKSKGFAEIVNRKPNISKHDLKKAIVDVINNPKYKNAVKKLKQLALDTPMTGLEKMIWWTEYVIRNKGAKHLRNPAADIPFYQYYLIDVISFLVFSLVSILTLLYFTLRTVYRYIKLHVFRTADRATLKTKKKQ